METLSFNTGWKYAHLGNGDWKDISLPHDAMISEPRVPNSAGGKNTGWFEAYDYEYVKSFDAPAEAAYIAFEGVYHNAEVFMDGESVPAHPNGYFGFMVPVTSGRHTIRVIAHNACQPSSRWYSGAGIYRPVSLICLPENHIFPDSIVVRTMDHKLRKIRISCKTNGYGPVKIEIMDGTKVIETDVTSDGVSDLYVKNAELWSPDNPKLYTARLSYCDDVQEIRFGIRTVEVDAKQGFRINGNRTLLLGACIHHDNGILGAACYPCADRRKIALLKKAGYNAIRSAHHPTSKAVLDACDELGMMVLDEYADMWYIHKTRYDYADYVEKNWRKDLEWLVTRDRNHPCVVMYSIGNEVAETAQQKGIDMTGQMVQLLHRLDNRPVTCGINIFFNFLSSMGLGVYSDEKARQEAAKALTNQKSEKAVGSEFINKVAGLLGAGFMKFGATLHGSDMKTRDAFAQLDVSGYNYGINRYEKDLRKYPDRVILGSETFASDAAAFYDLAKHHPAIIGDFVWTGMDYLGEVGLGAWEYSDYAPDFSPGPGWLTAGAGTLDLIGTETCQMAYTQVAFGLSPVRIGVIPVKYAGQRHSPAAWRFTNAIESWSWHGCEGQTTTVEVYARGVKAELLLNGKRIGRKRIPANCLTKFKATYEPGTLTAVIYNKAGEEICRTSLISAGEETRLSLFSESSSVRQGELGYVHLRYTDNHGMIQPLTRGIIQVTVDGGQLLALGNACSYNADGYLSDHTDVYYGEALAVIQPTASSIVTVRASSPFGKQEIHLNVVR